MTAADDGHERALVLATWALVAATVVPVIVTGLLAAATWKEKEGYQPNQEGGGNAAAVDRAGPLPARGGTAVTIGSVAPAK